MDSPLLRTSRSSNPFALDPQEAAQVFAPGMGTMQLARRLQRVVLGELDEFVNRWATWFAAAYDGSLSYPTRLPEDDVSPAMYRRG